MTIDEETGFEKAFLPAVIIIGVPGAVLLIQRTREHQLFFHRRDYVSTPHPLSANRTGIFEFISYKIRKFIIPQREGTDMRDLLFIVFLVAVVITAGCAGGNKETVVTPTPTPRPIEPIIIPSTTTQANQNGIENNGIIMYRNPEKIVKPEDLQIGDLIQMSSDDSRYDKDHGFIIENISSQNNQFLIKQIVWFKSENRWFGINTTNSVLITSGALKRDYPYKIGHAWEPLPEKCLFCEYASGGGGNWCSTDALIFLNCDDPRIRYNSSSTTIYPP